MRPLRVEMSGFGAFRDVTVIDLADVEFFALVGPTGSGKSTIIDAICFALYGSVPRYDDKRLVGSAMSLGRVEARVALTFAIGDNEYLAVRVVRRAKDGKVTTKEARLAQADGTLLAGRASEMDTAVSDLLGLSFEHFTRSVVLPQGDFARFLHDKASDRQDLLVSLLDLEVYERMAAAARQRAERAEVGRDFARRRLDELADATDDTRAAAQARVEALEELAIHLDIAEPEQRALDDAVAGHEVRATAARALAVDLASLTVPDAVRAHGRDHAGAVARLDATRRHHDEAAATLAGAVTARTGAPDRRPLERVLDAHEERDRVTAAIAVADARADDSDRRLAAATADRRRAEAAVAAAAIALEAARQASAAHVVAEALVSGAPCPVCGQVVHQVPPRTAPPAWQDAKHAIDAATAEAARFAKVERAAGDAHARAAAERDTLGGRAGDLDVVLASAPSALDARAAIESIDALDAAETAARAAADQAAAAFSAAEVAVTALDAARSEASASYTRARDRFGAHGPPVPDADIIASWDALVAWATEEARRQAEVVETAEADVAAARRASIAHVRELDDRFAAAGVVVATTHRAAVADARALAHQRVIALSEAIAERARLDAELAASAEVSTVARELARLLSVRGFERWLVADALTTLVAGASLTLRQLSSDQYSLALDDNGEFVVIDHANADERRGVRTLSGGETFQASLALALALADHLANSSARGHAKLDAIFLDEGFGTLDADSLETVAATIESLGDGRRTVGIVTHVRELAERVPVRFEVAKGPRTSTIERVER